MTTLGIHAVRISDKVDGIVPEDKRYSCMFNYNEEVDAAIEQFVDSFIDWLGKDSDIVLWRSGGWIEEKGDGNDTRKS